MRQRIKRSLSPSNIGALAMAILSMFLPLTGWFNEDISKILSCIGFFLLFITVILFVRNFYRNKTESISSLRKIVPTLYKMEKRLRQLQFRKYCKENMTGLDWGEYLATNKKINSLIGIIPKETNKELEIEQVVKDTENKITEIYQNNQDNLLIVFSQISVILDHDGFGLKNERLTDKRYRRFSDFLDELENNPNINKKINDLIDIHVERAEVFANLSLARARGLKTGIGKYASPKFQVGLEKYEAETKKILKQIRVEIAENIRMLEDNEKLQWIKNKTTN